MIETCQQLQIIEEIKDCFKKFNENLPYVIVIDGMSSSGKTTLGNWLHRNFSESNLFHMDDYFLQPYQRTDKRLAETGGNIDYERFKKEIIDHIHDPKGLTCQKYNCCTQKLEEKIYVPWKPIVIIEGSYSCHPYFQNPYHLRIFCEISSEEQKNRILKRNGTKMFKRFVTEWIPKENAYFKKWNIKENADIIL